MQGIAVQTPPARRKGPEHVHFTPVLGKTNRVKCLYCNLEITGGATKMRCHLARIPGHDVAICGPVAEENEEGEEVVGKVLPLAVYTQMLAIHKDLEAKSAEKQKRKAVQEVRSGSLPLPPMRRPLAGLSSLPPPGG